MVSNVRSGILVLAASLTLACGGSKSPAKTSMTDAPPSGERGEDLSVSAEVGGLNEDETNAVFRKVDPELVRCFKQRARQVELLSGEAKLFIVIGQDQRAQSVTVEQSDLGDREAEKCMIGVLSAQRWPRPVGGKVAHAHFKAAPFELLDDDTREPVAIPADAVASAVGKLSSAADKCKSGSAGPFTATAYLNTKGAVTTASVTSPDPQSSAAIDCLVELVRGATFPSPGSYPGKVSFEL